MSVSGIDESGGMVTTRQSKKCDNDVKSIPSSGLSGLRSKEDMKQEWIGVPASDFQDDFVHWKMMELECGKLWRGMDGKRREKEIEGGQGMGAWWMGGDGCDKACERSEI